jgi:hypothetical protein
MAQDRQNACSIEQIGKQRNGRPKFWCSAHRASATGPHGSRLSVCELAHRAASYPCVFNLDSEKFPGGIALWGAVAPVFDTTDEAPEYGIHVHARREINGAKDIDQTFDAVAMSNKHGLFDESQTLISGETAVSYYISRFLQRDIKHLFCINCGELHLDADYFAVKPHRQHLCHNCGRTFRADTKAVSNPIALLREQYGMLGAPHSTVRSAKKLDIHQKEFPKGIQVWASNPAFVWTSSERAEEEGIHVHAYDASGHRVHDDTYGEVILDGILLNEKQVQYYMAQSALSYLERRVVCARCPRCSTPCFETGEQGFFTHAQHACESCGTLFKPVGKLRHVVSNPFIEIRETLFRNATGH